jgi:hypothetical protein
VSGLADTGGRRRGEGPVEAGQCAPGRHHAELEHGVGEAGELAELLEPAHRAAFPTPCAPALLQCGVVELALDIHQSLEGHPLTGRGLQQETACPHHSKNSTDGL